MSDVKTMLIYMINTYIDYKYGNIEDNLLTDKYGLDGAREIVKKEILSVTGMTSEYFDTLGIDFFDKATIELNSNNYICTYENVIEIKANSLEEAIEKAKSYYKNKYHDSIKDKEIEIMDIVDKENAIDMFVPEHVKKIPSITSVLE